MIHMPKLLQEGCVLQRGKKTRIWGWYKNGGTVKIEFQDNKEETTADKEGYFEIFLSDIKAGGPYTLKVRAHDEELTIQKVYVGDVFICSGQSNMELPITRVRELFPDERGCEYVHHYKVEERTEFVTPLEDHENAQWKTCVGEDLEQASALGYFFAKMIYEKELVPVGIINISKGGTPAEAWTSAEGLKKYPEFIRIKEQFADENYVNSLFTAQEEREALWHDTLRQIEKTTVDAPWKELLIPSVFDEQGIVDFSGLLYLKKEFEVPAHLAGQEASLKLGTLVDSDETYINGQLVGTTGYCYPPRIYRIPSNLLKAGKNEVLIRLECRDGKGRVTYDKPCDIVFSGDEKINLRGMWKCQIRAVSDPAPVLDFINRKPSGMYQGMVAPCLNATVKGVIWYQGESNEKQPEIYEELLKGMISDWRDNWKQESLPFIIVQLPACGIDNRGSDTWAILREAQKNAAALPDVAMTVNLDLGEVNDLHPLDKKGVAARAMAAARNLMYDEEVVWQGPQLREIEQTETEIHLIFDMKDSSILETVDGYVPEEFEAAGADEVFYPIEAHIRGNQVYFNKKKEDNIKMIRYAWRNAPCKGLLRNKSGFLASPFICRL